MRADSNETEKLQCPACKTWACFRCRDVWHEDVSCKDAMNSQLKGWAEENKDNVSMCPMCNTRIEKNKGCNHMTCAFCQYEFCWACGASATIKENHYESGRGCGVSLMEENVKPGSHLNVQTQSKCQRYGWKTLKIVLCIIFFPIVLVFYLPYKMVSETLETSASENCEIRALKVIGVFFVALILNICFIPLILILIVMTGMQYAVYYVLYVLCCCCIIQCIRERCQRKNGLTLAEQNQERARKIIEQKMQGETEAIS